MLGAGRADAIALRLTGLRDGFLLQPLSLGPLCRPPGCFGCLPLHPLSLGPLRRQPRCLSFRAFLPPPLRLSGRQPRGLYPFPLPLQPRRDRPLHLLRRPIPVLPLLLDRLHHQLRNIKGNIEIGPHPVRRHRLNLQALHQQSDRSIRRKRQPAGQHLIKHQPSEYRSVRPSKSLPRIPSACSGDAYPGVPTKSPVVPVIIPVKPSPASSRPFAIPKSMTFTVSLPSAFLASSRF